MSNTNNVARRLYEVLRNAKSHSGGDEKMVVWADALKINGAAARKIIEDVFHLGDALKEMEETVARLAPDKKLYLRHVPSLRGVFDGSKLSGSWDGTRNLLTEETLQSLEFCATLIDEKEPEAEVPKADLDDLINQAAELLNQIATSDDLKPAAKGILTDLAQSLQTALNQYRVKGIKGLRAELFEVMRRLDAEYNSVPAKEESPVVAKVYAFIQKYQVVTSAVMNSGNLGLFFNTILPPLLK